MIVRKIRVKKFKSIYDELTIDSIKNFVKEIKSGRKSISDLDNETMWNYPPQTYEFDKCAECLGKSMKKSPDKRRKTRESGFLCYVLIGLTQQIVVCRFVGRFSDPADPLR